ncbi:MAG: hypothetical protein JWO22_1333 [Frankiales bacterium]|nr:hypothetical protein [Frankiales bacterium]
MSLLRRFQRHTSALPHASVEEHRAVVELLALAAYADASVTDGELGDLAEFDAQHDDWDDEGLSVLQHLPVAIAHARSGQSTVTELAARITDPTLRAEAVKAVTELLAVDGVTGSESAFLTEVRAALA